VLIVVLGAAGAAPSAARATVTTFSYTGSAQTWTVPVGVWSVSFDVFGGQGGDATDGSLVAPGGLGGEATVTLQVNPGQTFQINVGGAGTTNPSAGGFNNGSGGGGASDVRVNPFNVSNRVIVAGGGGGSGGDDAFGDAGGAGGAGGGGDGTAGGQSTEGVGGGGGGLGGVGDSGGGGGSGSDGGAMGATGSLFAGGLGGNTGSGIPGAGGFNGGADGGVGNPGAGETAGGGGGGGGGLFGGGGGGSGGGQESVEGGGGGGGGSSTGPTGVVLQPGVQTGDGVVTATYTASMLTLGTQVAPATVAVGATFQDTATLGPPPVGGEPPTGSVTFDVFAPSDPSCASSPVFTSTDQLDSTGTTATSSPFTAASAGTYHVIASYGGDSNYLPQTTACSDQGEAVTVTPGPLALATQVAPATIGLGASFDDTATLGPPPPGAAPPTGSVTFDVYAPGDASCTSSPVFTSTDPVDAAGTTAVSAAFTPPTAGVYNVIASYSGDANYLPAESECGDPGESATVTRAAVALGTQVAPAVLGVGGSFDDTATLGPPPSGAAPPTGSVTFAVYAPGDASCSAAPVLSSTDQLDASGTTAVSAHFTAASAGTYHVIASYSGDSNYTPQRSGCGDPGEAVSVVRAPTVTSISPSAGPQAGGTTVTVSGSDLSLASEVDFGGAAASQLSVNAAGTQLSAVSPAGSGVVAVTVVTPGGRSAKVAADRYTYLAATPAVVSGVAPASGPSSGGNGVVVMGRDFSGATRIIFGPSAGTLVNVNDAGTQVTALAPAGTGTVDVTVLTPAGTSATGAADAYTYVSPASPPAPSPATPSQPATPPPTPAPTPATTTPTLPSTPAQPTSQTGAPKVLGSSSALFTATIDPDGLATTMHFDYAVQPAGGSAAAVQYTARTPEQPVGADFSEHTVTATVAGLVPSGVYHVRAVATNSSGVAAGADATFATPKAPPPAAPVLGRSFNAQPISGTVNFFLPAHTHLAEPLNQALSLPVGTIIDATHGTVRLTSATGTKGRLQSGDFGGGRFELLQDRRQGGLTELLLIDPAGLLASCPATAGRAQPAAKRLLPKADLVLLRATAKGRFETRGRYSSATVRGTTWTTSNRCDGTFTSVKHGLIVVDDFRRHRLILLRAGHSYLAKAP
jgi:IPT/TIG domain-containing protein